MKVSMRIEQPTDVVVTMNVTMSLGEWRRVVKSLRDAQWSVSGSNLATEIAEALASVDQVFEPAKTAE